MRNKAVAILAAALLVLVSLFCILLQTGFIQPCFIICKGDGTFLTLGAAKFCFRRPVLKFFFFHISKFYTLIQSLVGPAMLHEYRVCGDFFFCLSVSADLFARQFFSPHNAVTVKTVRSSGRNKQQSSSGRILVLS